MSAASTISADVLLAVFGTAFIAALGWTMRQTFLLAREMAVIRSDITELIEDKRRREDPNRRG